MNEGPSLDPETYARWRATLLGHVTERIESRLVFSLAGSLAGARVLDVGSGDGTYAIEAARCGARVTALDVERTMLEAARTRAGRGGVTLEFVQGRAEQLPFADAAFDLVFAVTVLCFLPNPLDAVREAARVLAPGGRLLLGELARYSVWAAERRVRAWLGASRWRHAHFWSRRELEALAHRAGLRVRDVRGGVFFRPIALAARWMEEIDPVLSRARAPGAAFLALAAEKLVA